MNKLVGWSDRFEVSETERRGGFSRRIFSPQGIQPPWGVRVRFEVSPAGPHLLHIEVVLDDEKEQVEETAAQAEQEGPLQGPEREALPGEGGVGGEGPLPDAGPEQGQVVEGVGGEPEADLDLQEMTAFDHALGADAASLAIGRQWTANGVDPVHQPSADDAANACPEPEIDLRENPMGYATAMRDNPAFGRDLGRAFRATTFDDAPAESEPPLNPAWKMAFDLGALISTARGALDDLQVAACHAIDNGNACEGRLTVKESDDLGTVTAEVVWPYFGYEKRNFVAHFVVEGKLLKVEE